MNREPIMMVCGTDWGLESHELVWCAVVCDVCEREPFRNGRFVVGFEG